MYVCVFTHKSELQLCIAAKYHVKHCTCVPGHMYVSSISVYISTLVYAQELENAAECTYHRSQHHILTGHRIILQEAQVVECEVLEVWRLLTTAQLHRT